MGQQARTMTVGRVYPFEVLEPGQAFLVRDRAKEGTLRNLASRRRRQLGRKFLVSRVDDGILVARVNTVEGGIPEQEVNIVRTL